MSPADSSVWAIVILYRPDGEAVRRQHVALSAQVDGVVYYDNGGGRDVLERHDLLAEGRVLCAGDAKHLTTQPFEGTSPHAHLEHPIRDVLGTRLPSEALRMEHEGFEMGSISMRAFSFGAPL